MICRIGRQWIDARVIGRGSSSAPGCSPSHFPIQVQGPDGPVWVYANEGDGRTYPTDRGPVRPSPRGWRAIRRLQAAAV